jgi:hypothetical protein
MQCRWKEARRGITWAIMSRGGECLVCTEYILTSCIVQPRQVTDVFLSIVPIMHTSFTGRCKERWPRHFSFFYGIYHLLDDHHPYPLQALFSPTILRTHETRAGRRWDLLGFSCSARPPRAREARLGSHDYPRRCSLLLSRTQPDSDNTCSGLVEDGYTSTRRPSWQTRVACTDLKTTVQASISLFVIPVTQSPAALDRTETNFRTPLTSIRNHFYRLSICGMNLVFWEEPFIREHPLPKDNCGPSAESPGLLTYSGNLRISALSESPAAQPRQAESQLHNSPTSHQQGGF